MTVVEMHGLEAECNWQGIGKSENQMTTLHSIHCKYKSDECINGMIQVMGFSDNKVNIDRHHLTWLEVIKVAAFLRDMVKNRTKNGFHGQWRSEHTVDGSWDYST